MSAISDFRQNFEFPSWSNAASAGDTEGHAITKNHERPRLAIVSTFDDLCGIAGYTRFLVKRLEPYFDIEVFDLEQFFMRSADRRVRLRADGIIKQFCERMQSFDFVNIQLEHGTLGSRPKDILKRFKMLADAAPALSVTFHTVLPQDSFNWTEWWEKARQLNMPAANHIYGIHYKNRFLNSGIYRILRTLSEIKPVNIITHTRRDLRILKYVNELANVYDHPLAFLDRDAALQLRASTKRSDFPALGNLPQDAKIIGVFGFLTEYKGIDTAIRALHHLPDNYHLALFGGVHPGEIKKREPINPYIQRLIEGTFADTSVLDRINGSSVSLSLTASDMKQMFDHPRDISSRLHFMGAQNDEGFARGMAVSDVVVLPYLEVGQSSSGPLSIAMEMGSRVLASRNLAFMQFDRYAPGKIEFFEIGNHLELAERIKTPPATSASFVESPYNARTNTELYVRLNMRPEQLREVAESRAAPTVVSLRR